MEVKIEATNKQNKENVELAKLFEKVVQHQAEDLDGVLGAIVSARTYFISVFGDNFATSNDRVWNKIMEEVIKLKLELIKKHTTL